MSRLTRIGGFRSYWLICLIVPAALLLPVFTDQNWKPAPGLDDIQVTCAAVEAYAAGLDPYYVKNLKDTKLSYPYLPVTLDVFRPVCADGLLQPHYRTVFLIIGAMAALLLTLGSSLSGRDIAVRVLLVLGGFLGFEWTIFSGNFAVLTGLLTALVLALFQHGLWRRLHGQETLSFGCFVVGAAVLGALTSVKVTFFPLLLALYLLPHPRRNKLVLIGVGLGCFIAPVLISCLLYNDLFFSWIAAITGQIPGQHSPVSEPCTPSLLCLGQARLSAARPRPARRHRGRSDRTEYPARRRVVPAQARSAVGRQPAAWAAVDHARDVRALSLRASREGIRLFRAGHLRRRARCGLFGASDGGHHDHRRHGARPRNASSERLPGGLRSADVGRVLLLGVPGRPQSAHPCTRNARGCPATLQLTTGAALAGAGIAEVRTTASIAEPQSMRTSGACALTGISASRR